MYHFDVNCGASPGEDTVNDTPSELYVGLPSGENWFDGPEVKSADIEPPSAGSGRQFHCTKGLQEEYVCWREGRAKRAVIVAMVAMRRGELIDMKSLSNNMSRSSAR